MTKAIRQEELDQKLDALAASPETFSDEARELARETNAAVDLTLRDPLSWRSERPGSLPAVASIEEQLRAEIEAIQLMDREEEARLARRIEFARLRLDLALEDEGLTPEDLGRMPAHPSAYLDVSPRDCMMPPPVCRRWAELHSLRIELVERNLYLVLINVERYAHLKVSRLDLIQEGSAALFRAVDGFDWRRGLLFRTYAVHWLNQAFRSYLYNFSGTVRIPVYLQKAMKHVNQAIERLGDAHASAEAIAKEADLGVHVVESALAARRSTLSLDNPTQGEDAGGLGDILSPVEADEVYSTEMEEISLHEGLQEALGRLSNRERYVVEMRFGIGREREHTLSEVASKLGVSLERVRQIQVRAINKMRTPGLRKAVDPFL